MKKTSREAIPRFKARVAELRQVGLGHRCKRGLSKVSSLLIAAGLPTLSIGDKNIRIAVLDLMFIVYRAVV
jgi:hypothetical protein